jgi:hypothetical protein
MTIGVAAWGPNAGLAVFEALRMAERAGTGSIGGFAAFAAIGGAGEVLRAATQRGGSMTLFTDGEVTGTAPPEAFSQARVAAVMSSGPDRPEPLAQFVAADGKIGLVTGHRLPNQPGDSGRPLNLEVLALMGTGIAPQLALDRVLAANPEADAGMIAVAAGGAMASGNSARVGRRPDIGAARRCAQGPDGAALAVVEVLHNAIFPAESLAPLVADAGLARLIGTHRPDGHVLLGAGTEVCAGSEDAVDVDASGRVLRVVTTDERLTQGVWNCAAVYLGAFVRQEGRCIGRVVSEPNMIVRDGRVVSLSGQSEVAVPFRR